MFSEIYRVLKPGGRMRVSDIVAEELPATIRQSSVFYNSCVAGAVSEEEYLDGLQNTGLEEVQVLERLVYESDQIRALIGSDEEVALQQLFHGQPELLPQEAVNRFLHQIAGKIWSAKFAATKSKQ